MSKNETEKIIKATFDKRMKIIGLTPNKSKSMWVNDCGYYAIIVNLYPQKGFGIAFIVALHFLWNESQSITFDYYRGDSVFLYVPGTQGIGDSLLYDDPFLEEHLEVILQKVENEVQYFKTLNDYEKMRSELQKKPLHLNAGGYMDNNLACLHFILSEPKKTYEILKYNKVNAHNENVKAEMDKYFALLNNHNEFLNFLIENISFNRNILNKKFPRAFNEPYVLMLK